MHFGLRPLSAVARRIIAAAVLMGLAVATPQGAKALTFAQEWADFQRRYVAADGRIIDTGNAGISHSEGQSYGMLFALHAGDRESFDRIWNWTRQNLSRPSDPLHVWRFVPDARRAVRDPNNATDGDLHIAWALARAADRWNEPAYRRAATRIAAALLACCVREVPGRTLLLPGAAGFASGDQLVVNPSYLQFQALRAMARLQPDRRWQALEESGHQLLREARFGTWSLPSDWLEVSRRDGRLRIAAGRPPRFSWDALRVPLNLAWQAHAPELARPAVQFWADPRHAHHPPAWTDLQTNAIAPYPGHAGVRAVQHASRAALRLPSDTAPRVAQAPDYYGAALVLMGMMAAEMPPEPPPPPIAGGTGRSEPDRVRQVFRWLGISPSVDPAEAAPTDLPHFRDSRWTRNRYGVNDARVELPH